MRKPKLENKYNIRPEDLNKAEVIDRDRITRAPFWRNDLIKAWCLSGTTAKNASDNCIAGEYWICFYDIDAPTAKAGKVTSECSSYGGECTYKFKDFYKMKDIDNDTDLKLQELFLEQINWLIDSHIIKITKKVAVR